MGGILSVWSPSLPLVKCFFIDCLVPDGALWDLSDVDTIAKIAVIFLRLYCSNCCLKQVRNGPPIFVSMVEIFSSMFVNLRVPLETFQAGNTRFTPVRDEVHENLLVTEVTSALQPLQGLAPRPFSG